ncbi:DNA repair protein RadA [Candidatus Woesebacteria bacterium CG_4_10_14_0_2_um_filter_39_14]|uniref:DNA repair protein RadA n=2 Tax=Candidatus Woeseibacteriota TaxID=1752722 RepID=A0A2M7TN50_9BACT|nr:MAG: DNA repair protein RadA [Candidatus Woesebacteria bacterium CG_4_10_14_0_2_um_filter_39_14]
MQSKFVCQQCGYESVGFLGKCPNCGEWNSLVETVVSTGKSEKRRGNRETQNVKTIKLSDIKASKTARVLTKIPELDRVLGGGLVNGQVVLIAGEAGIGKSTLLLEVSSCLAAGKPSGQAVLYVCGEESASQVKVRAERLGIKKTGISLLEDTNVDNVIELVSSEADLSGVIVDSIQTMYTGDLSGMAGSVGQVRECAARLLRVCKEKEIPLFLVGHVTKEGTVAGPAVLAHIVDTVLWFEGDKTLTLRLLRAVKNRFGPTDEVGIFEMQDKGLISVTDSEKLFMEKSKKEVPGSVVTSILQGTRPMLVEIQALVVPTKMAFAKRVAQGIDSRRLELLLAVLIRRCGLPLYDFDVFVNCAGGMKVTEPGADLAIILAIASAYYDKEIAGKVIVLGEVGLLGEIREVIAQEKRIKEARRLGFTQVFSSKEDRFVGNVIKKLLK